MGEERQRADAAAKAIESVKGLVEKVGVPQGFIDAVTAMVGGLPTPGAPTSETAASPVAPTIATDARIPVVSDTSIQSEGNADGHGCPGNQPRRRHPTGMQHDSRQYGTRGGEDPRPPPAPAPQKFEEAAISISFTDDGMANVKMPGGQIVENGAAAIAAAVAGAGAAAFGGCDIFPKEGADGQC